MKVYLGRYPKGEGKRKISIRIDKWDTWSMDHTLALLISPMLKQLKATTHGAPATDDDDVPLDLRDAKDGKDGDVDSNHFKRWDYILDEMIWTFDALIEGDEKFFDHYAVDNDAPITKQAMQIKIDSDRLDAHHARIKNGLRLFGKYYQALWD